MSARGRDAAEPVSAEAFADRLEPLLGGAPALALGVSGGGDSMALMALAAAHARAHPLEIHVLTVDHGLRPESAEEARRVAEAAARLGLRHETLRWDGAKPEANLQAAAREARYGLMRAWRRAHGVGPLAVAHTLDDLAETFLLRLARGSGVDGLAAMAAERPDLEPGEAAEAAGGVGLRVIRPLLDIPREALRATCRTHGLGWVEDPSNQDPRFDRVAARRALEALGPLGLTRERLAKTAGRLRRARSALEIETDALLSRAAQVDRRLGWAEIDAEALAAAPREIGLRALSRLLQWVSGAAYPPRLEGLEAVFAALTGINASAGRTLHGCEIAPRRGSGRRWTVAREPAAAAAAAAVEAGAPVLWDGRFRARLGGGTRGLRIGALGATGATEAGRRLEAAGAAERWRRAPLAARRSAPGVWWPASDGGGWILAWAPELDPAPLGCEVEPRPPLVIER